MTGMLLNDDAELIKYQGKRIAELDAALLIIVAASEKMVSADIDINRPDFGSSYIVAKNTLRAAITIAKSTV